jgi:glucose-6-phosphate 1-epimerase
MPSIEQLNESFAIDSVARFDLGQGRLPRLVLMLPTGEAHICLLGAHVTHYHPAGQRPVLFVSSMAHFEAGKAIRGGVPICWPWFGPRDSDKNAMHGFVRTRFWDVVEVSRRGEAVRAVFEIGSSEQTRGIWDHEFKLRFAVTLGSQPTMELTTLNTSAREFTFEQALHSYLAVSDVRQIVIEGLAGTNYIDKVGPPPERKVDHANNLRITSQTDRVYINAPQTCTIEDPAWARRIAVAKDNSDTTVVWNPWSDRGPTIPDMGVEDWPKFVCVESANARDNLVKLPAGQQHIIRVRLRSEAL